MAALTSPAVTSRLLDDGGGGGSFPVPGPLMSFVYRLAGGQGSQEHMEQLHNEGERGREAADEGKQPTCSRREACVGFNNSAGFTFQPAGGRADRRSARTDKTWRRILAPLCDCEGGRGEGGGATAGADLSPAAAGQRGKLYRHLSAQ